MSVVRAFPGWWRCTVTVRRSGGRDPRGNPLPVVEHAVADCMVSTEASAEEAQSRSDAPETSAWLYALPGADFRSSDQVVVPDSPYWPSGQFQVTGEPAKTPLGVRVALRRL